jgi:hypothetical protein
MSSPSPPPDMSLAVEQQREQAQREAQAQQDAKDLAHKQELAGLRTTARNTATGTVDDYFSSHGVDPSQYEGSIASQLNNILGGISPTDENPGAAFTGAGQSIWDNLTTGGQTKAMNSVNQLFAPNYEMTRVPFTLDDPYLSGVEAEQYSNADKIIKNMLDRGVLTTSGYNAASQDLQNQQAGVRSRLNEIGTGVLSSEQQKLRDIANTARQTAGNIQLGQSFDPYSYSSQADQSFNDFIGSLGDQIRAQVPGQLFNTAGLAAIGGAGQGAGNTAYNPQAAAGIISDDTTGTDKTKPASGTNPNSIF